MFENFHLSSVTFDFPKIYFTLSCIVWYRWVAWFRSLLMTSACALQTHIHTDTQTNRQLYIGFLLAQINTEETDTFISDTLWFQYA